MHCTHTIITWILANKTNYVLLPFLFGSLLFDIYIYREKREGEKRSSSSSAAPPATTTTTGNASCLPFVLHFRQRIHSHRERGESDEHELFEGDPPRRICRVRLEFAKLLKSSYFGQFNALFYKQAWNNGLVQEK